jgi:hypothetical protein
MAPTPALWSLSATIIALLNDFNPILYFASLPSAALMFFINLHQLWVELVPPWTPHLPKGYFISAWGNSNQSTQWNKISTGTDFNGGLIASSAEDMVMADPVTVGISAAILLSVSTTMTALWLVSRNNTLFRKYATVGSLPWDQLKKGGGKKSIRLTGYVINVGDSDGFRYARSFTTIRKCKITNFNLLLYGE